MSRPAFLFAWLGLLALVFAALAGAAAANDRRGWSVFALAAAFGCVLVALLFGLGVL